MHNLSARLTNPRTKKKGKGKSKTDKNHRDATHQEADIHQAQIDQLRSELRIRQKSAEARTRHFQHDAQHQRRLP